MALSARGYDRVRKVAQTIADLAGDDRIGGDRIAETLQFRMIASSREPGAARRPQGRRNGSLIADPHGPIGKHRADGAAGGSRPAQRAIIDYRCGCISPRYGMTCPATTSVSNAIV
jgi:hypothetical protein